MSAMLLLGGFLGVGVGCNALYKAGRPTATDPSLLALIGIGLNALGLICIVLALAA